MTDHDTKAAAARSAFGSTPPPARPRFVASPTWSALRKPSCGFCQDTREIEWLGARGYRAKSACPHCCGGGAESGSSGAVGTYGRAKADDEPAVRGVFDIAVTEQPPARECDAVAVPSWSPVTMQPFNLAELNALDAHREASATAVARCKALSGSSDSELPPTVPPPARSSEPPPAEWKREHATSAMLECDPCDGTGGRWIGGGYLTCLVCNGTGEVRL